MNVYVNTETDSGDLIMPAREQGLEAAGKPWYLCPVVPNTHTHCNDFSTSGPLHRSKISAHPLLRECIEPRNSQTEPG